jgi:7-cyano-7-deazaguanine synthase
LRLLASFVDLTKSDIVRIGDSLSVPFQNTWSCYKGQDVHCGTCGTCVERKEAFDLANISDPTAYLA